MGYLDSKGLERAAWVTKNYAAQNWQMTKASRSNIFCPASQTELEPIVDFLFAETPPAEGEKSPTNPSTINGVSSVKIGRCGANLCLGGPQPYNLSFVENGWYSGTVDNTNGTETVYAYLNYGYYAKIDPEKSYCVVVECENCDEYGIGTQHNVYPAALITRTYGDHNTVSGTGRFKFDLNHTKVANPGYILRTSMGIAPGETKTFKFRVAVFQCKASQIDLDSYEYEAPPASWITTIALDGTYYGGSLNAKTGELTVTHLACAFDGTETWDPITAYNSTTGLGYTRGYPVAKDPNHRKAYEWFQRFSVDNASINAELYSCSHFPTIAMFGSTAVENSTITKPCMWYTGTDGDPTLDGQCRFAVPFSDLADFKTWLAQQSSAGTPLTVVYRINEPYTVQLSSQQILSLPQPDKYTPRINTVYTDQKSVRVGYRRLDCIELRSDQTVHGEKTFADSPLVPNPDNLDSQQAAPISFVKDMLRAEVEAMSGGKNTIIRDQWNNPHVMVRIPKFLLKDIDSSWPNEPHPAFIVNGVQKSEIFIGKYLASQSSAGKVQTLPRKLPWTRVSVDNSLATCRALGPGFGMNTNASWAARVLWLYKTFGVSHEYLGNRDYGRDSTYHELTGTMKNNSYIPGDTSIGDAATLTGSGGIKWIDDETAYGIDDLVGNAWEWDAGFRIVDGEINIISNNDAMLSTCDMSVNSTEWKAVLEDGTLVAPGTANTLKYNDGGSGHFRNLIPASNASVPNLLKQLMIFPIDTTVEGGMWFGSSGEFMAAHGSCWMDKGKTTPFALSINRNRSYTNAVHGFRTAYIA